MVDWRFATTSLLPWLTVIAAAQPGPNRHRPTLTDLDPVVLKELAATHTPGAAVAIVHDGKLIYAKGFGTSSRETGARLTADMLFTIGSTTKMFTAAVILMLAHEGRIDLDATVGRYLSGLQPKIAGVTARQLLSHTAGFADGFATVGPSDDSALIRTVRAYDDSDVFLEPGTMFSYSNPGFELLGALAQAVTGQRYAQVVEDRLLGPLGMRPSTFDPAVAMTYPRSQGHDLDERGVPQVVRPVRSHQGGWPSGGLNTNVYGLARFAIALMDSGRIDGRQVIPAAVVTAMFQPHSGPPFAHYKVNNFDFESMSYGYGAVLHDVRGAHIAGHNGDVAGFGSLFRTIPSRRVGVIVLANRSGLWLNRTAEKAMGIVMPLGPLPSATVRPVAMTIDELGEYVGTYGAPRQPNMILRADGGNLLLESSGERSLVRKLGGLRFVLVPLGIPLDGGELPFRHHRGFGWPEFLLVRGTSGKIEYLHSQVRVLKRQPE